VSTGNLTIAGNVSGSPTGARTFGPLTITSSAASDQTLVVALTSGDNTITVPAGATVAVISPPNASIPKPNPAVGITLKLKGAGGDTGVAISNTWPTELAWDTAPANFIINASTTGTAEVWFM
jgi:hypothetical protein